MSAYPHLSSPVTIGNITLPNRTVMGSMHLGLEEHPQGFERMAAFYAERVRGGTSLIVTGGIGPNAAGALTQGGATMTSEQDVEKHRLVTDAVHEAGGHIIMQLLHGGRYSTHPDLVAPSALQAPINRFSPRAMTAEEIESTIVEFGEAAKLALEAGYDGVEVMGSEGYLINEFCSPATNQRDDEWGGTSEKRRAFALAVTEQVRSALGPDALLSYRISVADLVPHGMSVGETLELAQQLEPLGVDMFVTGIGWHEARVPTIATSVPRAAFIDFTEALHSVATIPVVATNRINTPEVAEEILSAGRADLVALARPLLADPEFAGKATRGEGDRINTCIACNQACLDHIFAGKVASCLVNPRAGRETELVLLPTRTKRSVAVVGGGVAGMAAATSAASRGFAVTLFEARDSVGGQFDMAMRIPGKEEFTETIRYFLGELDRHGVTVKLGAQATASDLEGFDEVIIATGVSPRIPALPGVDLPHVASYAQVLRGEHTAGERVVILGAGGIGFDTAEFLTQKGPSHALNAAAFRESWGITEDPTVPGAVGKPQAVESARAVTILQRKATKAGAGLGLTTGWIHRAEVQRRGVRTMVGVQYDEIVAEGIRVTIEGEQQLIEADTVVLCTGQESVITLANELDALGRSYHLIGGAKLAGELDAKRAIREGTEVAAAL
ncbi:NADPH-dependent 2,4-dienoyl-CoA reductase [Leucobacter sp. UCMA 4100]|uniref:NADPH-dependent 2,4-dienoyl-CoA reductase n=1 Tax=Leucobacter sp. UCMA 4100 TaxID=2810534 RepID=UPI0022EA2DD8|nr:NADPH-dependent 2,4-dienoyl-CoA reductase [Leucobacter sp. UCMA 4100]MDA3146800.1 NADPH-dependent 2,4-dienoyl-CoA reductase [Leucobacter sp. UCMA 4100]